MNLYQGPVIVSVWAKDANHSLKKVRGREELLKPWQRSARSAAGSLKTKDTQTTTTHTLKRPHFAEAE